MRTRTETPPQDDERTVRLARKRFARRQWARRWLVGRVVLAVLLAIALVVGLLWLVFFSSALAVSGVRVEGTSVLDARAVRRAAQVPTGSPLATVDLDAVAARVEDLAPVLAVDVSRAWPDRVRIDVTERVAVAVVDRAGHLRGLDEHGVLFRDYASRPAGLPLVRTGPGADTDALAEAARVGESLPTDLAGRVDHITVQTVDDIRLSLGGGRTVLWGSAEESESKAEVLDVLLEQDATTYDVSVPGQPVIR